MPFQLSPNTSKPLPSRNRPRAVVGLVLGHKWDRPSTSARRGQSVAVKR